MLGGVENEPNRNFLAKTKNPSGIGFWFLGFWILATSWVMFGPGFEDFKFLGQSASKGLISSCNQEVFGFKKNFLVFTGNSWLNLALPG